MNQTLRIGDRIRLLRIFDNPHPIPIGEIGTVILFCQSFTLFPELQLVRAIRLRENLLVGRHAGKPDRRADEPADRS